MKTISRRICGVLLGVSILGLIVLCLIVPRARGDEMADWMAEQRRQNDEYHRQWQEWRAEQDRANAQAQAEREARDRAYYEAQAEQAARDKAYQEAQAEQAARDRWYYEQQQQREAEAKAQADREAMDKYWRDVQAAQDERAAWYKWQEEQQKWYENERWQKSYDEWMGRGTASADWSAPTGQIWFQGHRARQSVVILNSFVLKQMAREAQEKVRQQATEMGQQLLSDSRGPQLIQNPFVRSPK